MRNQVYCLFTTSIPNELTLTESTLGFIHIPYNHYPQIINSQRRLHIHNIDTISHHSLSLEYILNTKVTSDNTIRHNFICKPEDCYPVLSITSKVSQRHVCLKSLQRMLVALTELNSSLLSMYAVCLVLFAITCYLLDISFVNCGILQHCSSLVIQKNRKHKRSCQSVWTVNSHKILYRQS